METSAISTVSTTVAASAPTLTSTAITMIDLVSTEGGQGGAVVFIPSTTTVQTTHTLGYATTFTAGDPPAISIIFSPAPPASTFPTVLETFTPGQTVQTTCTHILTQIDATYFYANALGSVTATSTSSYLYDPYPGATSSNHDSDFGLDSWSAGAKAGLIVSVVFAAIILLWFCLCCYKRNAAWVAHDWRWAGAVEGGVPGMAGANLAHSAGVMSPATVMTTPSYGYATPSPFYMRGGSEKRGKLNFLADKLRSKRNPAAG